MIINKICLHLLLALLIISCNEKKAPDQEVDISNFLLTDHIKLELNNDTVLENSYLKGLVTLTKPRFTGKNSEIVVVIEDSLEILKYDLSNERETFFAVFTNLECDTINRKYFPKYDPTKTAAFGKKMEKEGSHKIRGYVMEYYGIELGPNYDITSDSLTDQKHKIYFEKEITVLPN